MLTYDDCLSLCGLSEAEVAAIAEHEHIPPMIATEMAAYLASCQDGRARLRRIILDDIDAALARGDEDHARLLRETLVYFAHHRVARNATTDPAPA